MKIILLNLNNPYILLFVFFISFNSFSQKSIKDLSIQELTKKRMEAIASKSTSDVEIFDLAITYKAEIDAALKVEDYDKAATIQEKLALLKLKPSTSFKIKELEEAIKKAVATEDFEKAEQLKQEIDALKGVSKSLSSTNTTSTLNTSSKSSSHSVSTKLTKNDIYGFSAIWVGLDFSLFNFISEKKIGEEQEHKKNVAIWQKEFNTEIGGEKLGKWLKKTQFIDDRTFIENLAGNNLNRSWIISQNKSLSSDVIQNHLLNYKSNHHGLGLVFIPESFDEIAKVISIHIVWFDTDTKAIVHSQLINLKGVNPGTMTNRWGGALIDCTKTYVDQYYRKQL